MKIKNETNTFWLCISGIMSALIFVATYIRIDIPIGPSTAMISLGNVLCIASGLLLSPVLAGLSSGTGSFIFDLVTPQYLFSAPFTFFSKFCMSFICSKFIEKNSKKNSKKTNFLGALSGILSFIIIRTIKVFIYNKAVLNLELWANIILASKSISVTIINSVLALIFALPLALSLERSLLKIGLNFSK
ncbi:MAG: ECF transporter S component [Oscillospiraceae bacterium]|jgi:uncharacterized membrane protein|nr:ECF transporter S component [Oscillospiraceae bacterium]